MPVAFIYLPSPYLSFPWLLFADGEDLCGCGALKCSQIALHVTHGVRCDGLDRVFLALDYFHAFINRVSAWGTGFRNLQKALLYALLEPNAELKKLQDKGELV